MRQYFEIPKALCVIAAILLTVVSCGNRGGQPINHEVIQGITMVSIPSGTFDMGFDYTAGTVEMGSINVYYTDEQPVHTVHLSAFQMSSTEITQEQFAQILDRNPSTFTGDENLPVTNVGATEALLFCNKLSEAAGFDPCYDEGTGKCNFSENGFRLPTEAEWEYACRAGTKTHFYTGSTEQSLDSAGWYIGNSNGTTHPVAQKQPNAWGLYDMHGNVFEFCYDGYEEAQNHSTYPSGEVTDPVNSENFNYRMMRGGGWFSEPSACRSFTRSKFWTGGGNYYIGFRVVRRP